jgi:pyruvate dehydrogenase E2 component (dihydrolipoamide acetyltransferase)
MATEIRIPNIGDVEDVEVIELCVKPGDTVGEDDPLIVIESDKASMEVPAGVAGTVESLLVAVGDAVQEGQPIAMIASADDGAEPAAGDDDQPADGPDEEPDEEPADESADESDDEARPAARAPSSKQAKAPSRGEDDAEATGDDGADDSEVSVFVPSIGDAKDVVVIEVGVKAGDTVGPDDLIVVVESDKASMEIPAGASGEVIDVHVREGDPVEEGTLLATLRVAQAQGRPPADDAPSREGDAEADRTSSETARTSAAASAKSKARSDEPGPPTAAEAPTQEGEKRAGREGANVYAGPATRRLARELGVALAEVTGSGARGRIVKDVV